MDETNTYAHHTDWQIIQRINAGETTLFELLIRRHNPYLYKTGRSYRFNHEDTQDLMQETFISAYMNLRKFENRSSFRTWLVRIMLNNCFQKKQRSSYRNELAPANELNENARPMYSSERHSDTDKTVANRELHRVIERSLEQVPLEYRMVFSLRELSGLSTTETAEALEISEANVKTRLSRAKEMLRREIEKTYSAEELYEFNLAYCDAMVARVMKNLPTQTPSL